jgi:hypothetical protein
MGVAPLVSCCALTAGHTHPKALRGPQHGPHGPGVRRRVRNAPALHQHCVCERSKRNAQPSMGLGAKERVWFRARARREKPAQADHAFGQTGALPMLIDVVRSVFGITFPAPSEHRSH